MSQRVVKTKRSKHTSEYPQKKVFLDKEKQGRQSWKNLSATIKEVSATALLGSF
jgi:hypothetical protein